MVDYSSYDSPYKTIRKQGGEYLPGIADTMMSWKAEIRSCKLDNDRLVEAQERLARDQEKQEKVNAMIPWNLSNLDRYGQLRISQEHE